MMRVEARAKTNLFLDVLGRYQDGFHALASLIVRLSLADSVELCVSEGPGAITFECQLSTPLNRHMQAWEEERPTEASAAKQALFAGNLAVKAARCFLERAGLEQNIDIRIEKRIPLAAGLGGGSADAAAVLSILNKYFPEALSYDELIEIGFGLGTDVPVLLKEEPQVVLGRGEKFFAASSFSEWRELHAALSRYRSVILLKPPIGSETAAAYAEARNYYVDLPTPGRELYGQGEEIMLEKWRSSVQAGSSSFALKHFLENSFQQLELPCSSYLERAYRLLSGADGVVLSGSGSAVVGFFSSAASRQASLERLEKENGWFVCASDLRLDGSSNEM